MFDGIARSGSRASCKKHYLLSFCGFRGKHRPAISIAGIFFSWMGLINKDEEIDLMSANKSNLICYMVIIFILAIKVKEKIDLD